MSMTHGKIAGPQVTHIMTHRSASLLGIGTNLATQCQEANLTTTAIQTADSIEMCIAPATL